MPLESPQALTCEKVPQLQRVVIRSGDDPRAVRGETARPDIARMSFEGSEALGGRQEAPAVPMGLTVITSFRDGAMRVMIPMRESDAEGRLTERWSGARRTLIAPAGSPSAKLM